ncbi:acyltransferase family protein [Schaalia suimastitidis]|uniref:acyltransferase family protein n=1 Tax=Schaalia suimastitidis TaxID=121163 RepID=UPI0004117D6C|nr:acyltransferase [Schaalia suimastitidis]
MTLSTNTTPRQRLFYLDLVRSLAVFLIILTHFNNPFLTDGGFLIVNRPFGIYVGDLGVSLFLIISGAALGLTYRSAIDLKKYYWKRFLGIYPMFWIAWLLGTLYFFLDLKGHPINASSMRSIIWTVLGVDGLISNFNVQTTYLLGEWFLGFIIIFYLFFPLLSWSIDRFPILTALGIAVAYIITIYFLNNSVSFPLSVLLTTRLPELAFGIYFIRRFKRVPLVAIVGAVVALIATTYFANSVQKDVSTTVVGIAVFLLLVALSEYVAILPLREGISLVAKYSYPIFLVHHVVIYKLFNYSGIQWQTFTSVQLYMFFVAICVISFALSLVLDRITMHVIAFFKSAFYGKWWRLHSVVEPEGASSDSGSTELLVAHFSSNWPKVAQK